MLTRSKTNENINNIIYDLNEIDPLLLSLLSKDSLLSGSFLLQSLMNETFDDKETSDIDFFCTRDEYKRISALLLKNNYIEMPRPITWTPFTESSKPHYCSFVESVYDFKKNGLGDVIVQLIVCTNHPIETIRDFDLDILENNFDGENLEIQNYKGIKNCSITIQNKVKMRRIEKYKMRGFTFTNLPNGRHLELAVFEFNKNFD